MNWIVIRASLILLLTSMIWGSAFVAQKSAMQDLGPFWFVALRYGLSFLILLPFMFISKGEARPSFKDWTSGILLGCALTGGTMLQQYGIQFTSVANSGFISSLSVILVLVLGIFLGNFPRPGIWFGAILCMWGLSLITVPDLSALSFSTLNEGDVLMLLSTLFWVWHVTILSTGFGRRLPVFKLAGTQFFICAVLSTCVALLYEPFSLQDVWQALVPLLYAAIFSSCIGFSLQIIGQKHVPAAPAAIIFSLQAVFAALAAWFILGETMSMRSLIGCSLMLAGLIVAQLTSIFGSSAKPNQSS